MTERKKSNISFDITFKTPDVLDIPRIREVVRNALLAEYHHTHGYADEKAEQEWIKAHLEEVVADLVVKAKNFIRFGEFCTIRFSELSPPEVIHNSR